MQPWDPTLSKGLAMGPKGRSETAIDNETLAYHATKDPCGSAACLGLVSNSLLLDGNEDQSIRLGEPTVLADKGPE